MNHRNIRFLLKQCIAVMLMLVLLSGLSLPGYAAEKPKAAPAAPAATVTVQAGKKKTILIGDSRTANLRQVRNNGKLVYDLIQQDGSILWDFKWGAKFFDLAATLIPRLELSGLDTIDSRTTIVVWMGFNDVVGTPSATVNEYINYYNLMTALWVARGARVYIMNVGPAGRKTGGMTKRQKENYKAQNKQIRTFNRKLKEGLSSQAKYIDCYAYLMETDYATSDGTHYIPVTSRGIYKFILKKTK